MTEHGPSTVTDPTDSDGCPMCGDTTSVQRTTGTSPRVQAWSCTTCRTNWATTVVNSTVRAALSVIGLLPTPQQRPAALLDVLRTEVTQRSGKEPGTMTVTVCLPATEVISIDAMASVDTVVWHADSATTTALQPPDPRRTPRASST